MRLRTAALAALSLAFLAACSKKPAQPPAVATAPTAAAPAPAAPGAGATITAADLPRPKAGYWESTVTGPTGSSTNRSCASGKPVDTRGMNRMTRNCSQFSFKRGLFGGATIDAVCGAQGMSSTLHMDLRGDFNSNYVWDTTMSLALPGQPPRTFKTHAEAHYLGPCPAGVTPRD
ncbi:MAG: DUF3617 domain-containing protein [Caulobacteraceae bacterium]